MNLQDFATLAEAKLYTQQIERELPLVTLIKGLVQTSSITTLEASVDPRAKGFLLMITSGVPFFDFRNSSAEGLQYQSVLSALVGIGAVTQGFYNGVIAYCNYDVLPFENATEHAFQVAKGTIENNLAPITVENGHARITVSADVEAHNPQIRQKLTFADSSVIYKRVAGFSAVSVAGEYQAQCPNLPDLFVDNAYGVIS